MAADIKKYLTNDQSGNDSLTQHMVFTIPGDLADATTYSFQWIPTVPIQIVDIQLSLAITGTDGTDVEVDLADDGTSIFSTNGGIAVAAAAAALARVGGTAATGVVHPVLDATKEDIAASSLMLLTVVADGTFTVQPNDATVVVSFKEHQDFDPAP